jgi:hypothetical protein
VSIERYDARHGLLAWMRRRSLVVQAALYGGAALSILFFGIFAQTQFIYFRF